MEEIFDFIFSPDECAGFIKKKFYSHHFPVDFKYIDKYLTENEENDLKHLTILHAPSSYHIKGTAFIEEAIANLRLKYPNLIYKRLHNISKAEVIKELINADVVIDQMLVGYYGVLAVEAMALEKPIICYISQDIWENIKSYCPIINANPDNIEEIIEFYINNKKNLKEIGKKSRTYALDFHSPEKIAEKC